MLELQSPLLLAVTLLLAVVTATAIVVLWTRRGGTAPRAAWVMALLGRIAMLALVMTLSCFALFLQVNNSFGFYTSWADLFGVPSEPGALTTSGLVTGKGSLEKLAVTGTVSHGKGDVLVWLPPQYHDPAWKDYKFPVVMMLPGQSGPAPLYSNFEFGSYATHAIQAGDAKPFVGVFPPIVIAPPRDTECVNVPGGPQAESWLTKDVTSAIVQHYRVQQPGAHWSITGWSTGGFCAANLSLRNPKLFGVSVPLGGNFVPYLDRTTGDLFAGNTAAKDQNTPLRLYRKNGGTGGVKMLIVAGVQDPSWKENNRMIQQAKGDPNVASLVFPTGGHNYRNYRGLMPDVFKWLTKVGALGA